ncbi:MAG: ABC transporter substrate-binding protein [Oligoflexus sp.]|jgi:iron complex transport system substrate-binding protein
MMVGRVWLILGAVFLLCFSPILLALPQTAPQRIASGTVGTDEIVFELLGARGELKRLVAVSIFSDNPRYSHLEKIPPFIKGRVGNSLESLLVLKPDLAILASYNRSELSRELIRAGVKVAIQEQFRSLDDVLHNIRTIGDLIEARSEAQALIQSYRQQLETLAARRTTCPQGRQPTILQYSEYDTLPGQDTIFNDAARQAGYLNLAAEKGLKGWAPISQEILVSFDPDWIVAAGEPRESGKLIASMQSQPGWKNLRAIREKRLIVIPERLLSSVSHHTIKLVRALSDQHSCRASAK